MIIAPPPKCQDSLSAEQDSLLALRRAAIDEVATTRVKVIRCGLFGTYLFRNHPGKTDGEDVRQSWVAEMTLQLDGIERAYKLVRGLDPQGVFPNDICRWISQCAARQPDDVATLEEMVGKTRALIAIAPAGGAQLEKGLIDHAVFGRERFSPAIGVLCDLFWSDLDRQRQIEVDIAQASRVQIGKTLTRLEHIGKHVRLVSLNASVEAARVGDAGKGLGVIAQEFKSLAEEIQSLAQSGRDNIDKSPELQI